MTSTAPAFDPRANTDVAVPARANRAAAASLREPAYQAYLVLRTAFVVAPILFGIDKFFNWMTFWPKYLWVGIPNVISVSPQHFMYAVGVVEIAAGVLVLLWPRVAGIVTNVVIKSIAVGGHTQVFWDIALRDFGLMIAAVALARLAAVFAPALPFGSRSR
jgi:uncharacterized membrane protein YphA (DoxX/SURF4 family)